jgi:cation diffusion facilitator CzcD-associated flavoprotein CzcO
MSTGRTADFDGRPALWGGSVTPRVAIVGAGIGGLGQAVKLLQSGISTFTVFERSAGPGGTWWDNTYPGAACDIPSLLYSFDFMNVRWKRTHASQAEIQEYLETVIDRFGFRDHIRFGTGVKAAEWDESLQAYRLTTEDGAVHVFEIVVSAVGMLNVPNEVRLPGLESFTGEVVHSARWGRDREVAGKRVAVIGAGASAAQIIPAIVDDVEHLVSFQREPSWVMPKDERTFDAAEFAELASPRTRVQQRREILKGVDSALTVAEEIEGEVAQRFREIGLRHLRESLPDRPDLVDLLTPTYPLRCKRTVQSNTLLPALAKDNVQLVPRGVAAFSEQGLVDTDGVEHRVDLVVLATGFQTTNYLATMELRGRGGRSLHEYWGEDPRAFLGITVPGFPNFFMLYGPNTHGTVVSYVLERQAEFVAASVREMVRRRAGAVEVRAAFAELFDRILQWAIGRVPAWTGGCHNYYHSPSGRNVTQWPWSHPRYRLATRLLRRPSSRWSRVRPAPPTGTAERAADRQALA